MSTTKPDPEILATFTRNLRTKAIIECLYDYPRWETYLQSSLKGTRCTLCTKENSPDCSFSEGMVGCLECLGSNETCSVVHQYREDVLCGQFRDSKGDARRYLTEFYEYEAHLRTVMFEKQQTTWADVEAIECAAKSGQEHLQWSLDGIRNLHASMDLEIKALRYTATCYYTALAKIRQCAQFSKEEDVAHTRKAVLEMVETLANKVLHADRKQEEVGGDGEETMVEAVEKLTISSVHDDLMD
ncbi:hypothetical protein BKA70DRAFT_1225400 [Coprinopsis sp. MPI-PUGE-AT-0042]|nr:hypothetical protein BKA70DRAFT_1433404 [Coprinopsis sp. MPI-PUGE-AT-0042]KAH6905691.1 hypothetical protein BKA70DRAFT_1225400 [Coprinopsis sp. MPI-PUGE-AT-0042]